MTIPTSHLKEGLSVSYVRTVTAKAGAQYLSADGTEYGTDAIIQKIALLPNGSYTNTGWSFNCQIKSTVEWIEAPEHIIYDMQADAFNKLVCWEGTPCILVLFRLPKNENDWIKLDEYSLELKNCCYWAYLKGSPTNNTSSIRVEIPRNQLFTPEAVNDLLDQIKINQGILP